jgi:hypothetical protein
MGRIAGYTPADYLVQHATRERRTERVPGGTWDAILAHITDRDDITRLANSADSRLLYRYAIPLYRHAADAGDQLAARRAATLLAERGDLDGAQQLQGALRDTGYERDAYLLDILLTDHEWERPANHELRSPEVRLALAEPGKYSSFQVREPHELALIDRLAELGDLAELQGRADAGDSYALERLAVLLEQHGDLDGAEQVLRGHADNSPDAARHLAALLARRGDLNGAEHVLHAQIAGGDLQAGNQLRGLLADQGRREEANRLLQLGLNADGTIATA